MNNMNAEKLLADTSQSIPNGTIVISPITTENEKNPEESQEDDKIEKEDVQEQQSDEVFSSYLHREIIPGCKPHPGDIVEAGTLAALLPPESTYPLADSLPEHLISESTLSSLQLEGVLHACQRHQSILPSGQRAGFFIGDGAGVGKGRQIAGIILDNFARRRKRHVWFSISADLVVDARRDLVDIGCHIKVIEGCKQLDKESRVFGLPADFKEGVVFSTYATLVSSVHRGGNYKSRLNQLVEWCGGENFEGCLVFDECHKAKNFKPGREESSTKVAMAVATIQRVLPKARVVYCSATGVSDVKNMAFMERLGLWGDGAAFKSFDHFIEVVQRKGLGVAEMLAMEMKTGGMYVSRGLSFKEAEFLSLCATLTAEQRKQYNAATRLWSELRRSLEVAQSKTRCTNARLWSVFWSAHQRFFKQLCMGFKVPEILRVSRESLDNDRCVVIGLQTTGEASLEANRSGGGSTGFVSLCREIIKQFVMQHFPTVDSQSKQVDEWSTQAKQLILGFADKLQLPNSPLDELIDELGGPQSVAEMTGRRARVVRASKKDQPRYELRGAENDTESLNVQERNAFMSGKKLVAIISDAASTGISLHADLRCANQRRRVHVTLELPWSADKAVQQLGRSHRSNQSSAPLYILVTSDLGGERRFAAAVARRLQSLGALTKGDRRAASGLDLREFELESTYGRAALHKVYTAICQRAIIPNVDYTELSNNFDEFNFHNLNGLVEMGLLTPLSVEAGAPWVADKESRDVGRFLNRILGLNVALQNQLFLYFSTVLKLTINEAKTEGRYNEGLVDIVATSVQMEGEARVVFSSTETSHNPTRHTVLVIDRGMPFEAALARMEHNPGKDTGWYQNRRKGRPGCILAHLKSGSSNMFQISRPNTGLSRFEETRSDFMNKFKKVSQNFAEKKWKEQYEEHRDQCIHGGSCKARPECTVGVRIYKMHLLCGGIVKLLNVLETALARYGASIDISKADMTLKIMRARLDDGQRVVGVRYPEALIPLAEKLMVEQQMLQKAATEATLAQTRAPEASRPITLQEPTPVDQKSLQRAFTPPITIKNFFSPSSAKKIVTKTLKERNEDDFTESQSNTEDAISDNQLKENAPTPSRSGIKREAEDDATEASNTKRHKQSSSKQQSSLLSAFSKQSRRVETVKQEQKKCPVCHHHFDEGVTNMEINNHIDNCVIE